MNLASKRYLEPEKDNHSNIIGWKFKPTTLMLLMLYECVNPKNAHLSTREIFKQRGVAYKNFVGWQKEYIDKIEQIDPETKEKTYEERNWFVLWWEEQISLSRIDLRQMLAQVGMQRALKGDYNFWRDLSKTWGVIANEEKEAPVRGIPLNLGKENASIDEIRIAKHKLLAAHRGVGDPGGAQLAPALTVRPKSPAS